MVQGKLKVIKKILGVCIHNIVFIKKLYNI